jgi:hypothetical protein
LQKERSSSEVTMNVKDKELTSDSVAQIKLETGSFISMGLFLRLGVTKLTLKISDRTRPGKPHHHTLTLDAT